MVPLAVGDRNVGRELQEDRRVLGIVLKEVDENAGIDRLKKDATVGRVELGAVKNKEGAFVKKDSILPLHYGIA